MLPVVDHTGQSLAQWVKISVKTAEALKLRTSEEQRACVVCWENFSCDLDVPSEFNLFHYYG